MYEEEYFPYIEEEYPDATEYEDFSVDEISDEEMQEILKDDYIVDDYEDEGLPFEQMYAPRGSFYKDRYVAPKVDRMEYIDLLDKEGKKTKYAGFSPLDSPDFIHINRTYSIDFYLFDMKRILSIFKNYYGEGKLYVINGFRSPYDIGVNPHSVGIAIDIESENMEQARRIMNAAYMAGIPTIIPNGEFNKGEGYVHLDIAPAPNYIYDAGRYTGPWS